MTVLTAPDGVGTELDPTTHTFAQLIDGRLVAGAGSVPVVDPATGESFASAPTADATQLDEAVAAARKAFPAWSALPADERGEIVGRIADDIDKHAEFFARLTTLEQGKPLAEARIDVELASSFARHFSQARVTDQPVTGHDDATITIRRTPIGVVGTICPWNFPLFQAAYKLAPALVTGNTVVLKPSPTTPLSTLLLAEIISDYVPAGVLNVLGDDGSLGAQLTAHTGIDKIAFTGSTAVGHKVMTEAADPIRRLTLELGGNDSAIVLDDVDVAETADQIFGHAFSNSGQVCISIKRIFVPSAIYDEFVSALAERAQNTVVGHGLDPATQMGPVQNAKQFASAKKWLTVAAEDGTIVAGGTTTDGSGYFVAPTIVRDIDDSSSLVTDETFGPIRSVLRYDDVEDAVARANDTQYGLGSSVWGADAEKATEIAKRLQVGTVWVNQHFSLLPDVPFGGHKQSGLGVEFGEAGLEEFTNIQVLNIKN